MITRHRHWLGASETIDKYWSAVAAYTYIVTILASQRVEMNCRAWWSFSILLTPLIYKCYLWREGQMLYSSEDVTAVPWHHNFIGTRMARIAGSLAVRYDIYEFDRDNFGLSSASSVWWLLIYWHGIQNSLTVKLSEISAADIMKFHDIN